MTTKLDDLVEYLAGRNSAAGIMNELSDPASDASRFLEAARIRSRALVHDPATPIPAPRLPSSQRQRWSRVAWIFLGLFASALMIGWLEFRFQKLEARWQASAEQSRLGQARIEALTNYALQNPADSPGTIEAKNRLAQVETRLNRVQQSLAAIENLPEAAKAEALTQVRQDLNNLRLEFAASEKTRSRQWDELQSSVHEINRVIRLWMNRLDPSPPAQESPRLSPSPRSSRMILPPIDR